MGTVARVGQGRICEMVLLLLQVELIMMNLCMCTVLDRRDWLVGLRLHWNELLLLLVVRLLLVRRRGRGGDRRPILPLTLLVGQRPGGLLGCAHVVPAEGDQLLPGRREAGGGLERLSGFWVLSRAYITIK